MWLVLQSFSLIQLNKKSYLYEMFDALLIDLHILSISNDVCSLTTSNSNGELQGVRAIVDSGKR